MPSLKLTLNVSSLMLPHLTSKTRAIVVTNMSPALIINVKNKDIYYALLCTGTHIPLKKETEMLHTRIAMRISYNRKQILFYYIYTGKFLQYVLYIPHGVANHVKINEPTLLLRQSWRN